MRYTKSLKYAIKFDKQMWAKIEEIYRRNFPKAYAVITLRNDMGMIKETVEYVYGYAKKNADNIKSIALYGQQGDMTVSITLHTSKNTSPTSMEIDAENIDPSIRREINKMIQHIRVLPAKFNRAYIIIKSAFAFSIYMLLAEVIAGITGREVLAALLATLAAMPFWFIVFISDYIIKRMQTGDEWIQFWVDEKHIERYKNTPSWKLWQYIMMIIIALMPIVLHFLIY
ncbi:MAG: hypothetical protein AB1Z23_13145 [Eubacteriales bacterium]